MNKKIDKTIGWLWLLLALVWVSMGELYPFALIFGIVQALAGRNYIKR